MPSFTQLEPELPLYCDFSSALLFSPSVAEAAVVGVKRLGIFLGRWNYSFIKSLRIQMGLLVTFPIPRQSVSQLLPVPLFTRRWWWRAVDDEDGIIV